jgi:predicted esterase
MALFTALGSTKHTLKGAFGLVTYNLDYNVINRRVPVFIYQGTNDKTLPWAFTEPTFNSIRRKELIAEYHLGHATSPGMMAMLRTWLMSSMNPRSFL